MMAVAGSEVSNLTDRQLLIWIEQKLCGAIPVANMVATFDIAGAVDHGRLEHAFQLVIRHCDALRIVIDAVDGVPQQRFVSDLAYQLDFVDVSHESDSDAAFATWKDQRSVLPLVPTERLFDSALVKISGSRFIWYLCQHHLITDAWAFGLILERTSEIYRALGAGSPPELLAWPKFEDHIAAIQASRDPSATGRGEAHRPETLATGSEPIELYGRDPATGSAWTRRRTRRLGPDRVRQLRAIVKEEGVRCMPQSTTLPVVFSALLFAYLHRVSGNGQMTVGMPTANRRSKVAKETAGLFMEVGLLRVEISPDDTFRSLLEQVRSETFGLLRQSNHCHSNPTRDRLYEVFFNFHTAVFPDFDGVPTETILNHAMNSASMDPDATPAISHRIGDTLALQVQDRGGADGLVLSFDFDRSIFDDDLCDRAVTHFFSTLDAFLADRGGRLASVELPSAAERELVMVGFNSTAMVLPERDTVVDLFETQVSENPECTAARFGDSSLTYAELGARVIGLAQILRQVGVAPRALVGVCADRSLEMLIALLATMKVGAAYVPIDPEHPKARIEGIISDADLEFVLTQSKLRDRLFTGSPATILYLDDLPDVSANKPEALDYLADPSGLAYVIFTSGSTGRPKGVEIQHRALLNFLESMRREPGLREGERLLAITTVSFDIAALELFLPLVVGGEVELVAHADCVDAERLRDRLESSRPDVMQATPTTWRMLVEAGWAGSPGLRILSGGEPLSRELADELLRRGKCLWNMYGPTETTIWSTVHEVTSGDTAIRIGKPIANTFTGVLDAQLRPVPIGVTGELFIGGEGLARGYLNRPDLTGERFVRSPFISGDRLYQTGDLARVHANGELECLGRFDHQVKIRGFRIELGEIETALRKCAGVSEAVVLVTEFGPGDRRLIGYVVASPGCTDLAADVDAMVASAAATVRETLPDYMVPSQLVSLPELPRTPNEKIDRKRLAEGTHLGTVHVHREKERIEPRDDTERLLVEIWQQTLGVAEVGVRDDFFHLGGHSLLAVQLFARIRKTLHVDLSLSTLFDAPTIESFAHILNAPAGAHTGTDLEVPQESEHTHLVSIQKGTAGRTPLFVACGAFGNVLNFRALARAVGKDRPFYGLQARGLASDDAPHTSFEEMARGFLAEIRTIQPNGPYLLAGFCSGGVAIYEIARQLRAAGEETPVLLLLDSFLTDHDRLHTLAERVSFHWQGVRKQGPSYAWRWCRDRVASDLARLRKLLGRERMEEDLSVVRSQRIFTATFQALHDYKPEPYPGKVVLFHPPRDGEFVVGGREVNSRREFIRHDNGWHPFAENLESSELPAQPGDHDGILEDPCVEVLGARMRQSFAMFDQHSEPTR
jgi:amino acid adenylation domain-containing protein